MEWVKGLQKAIDYIEDHITEDIDYAEIAKQAYSSSFHFQRVFHIICGYSIGEYIRNRRLSLAGTDLSSGNEKVIDIALKYGYNSPESFSRAFTKFHGITPVQAKNEKLTLKSFSRVSVKITLEGGTTMDYRIEKRESRFAIDPSGKDRPNKIFFIPFYEPFVPCTPKKQKICR